MLHASSIAVNIKSLASFEDALEVEAKYRAREINGLWSYIYIYIYIYRERERERACAYK